MDGNSDDKATALRKRGSLSSEPLMIVLNFLIVFALERAINVLIPTTHAASGFGLFISLWRDHRQALFNFASLIVTIIPFVQGSHAILGNMFKDIDNKSGKEVAEYFIHYAFLILEGIGFVIAGAVVDDSAACLISLASVFVVDLLLNWLTVILLHGGRSKFPQSVWNAINAPFVLSCAALWFFIADHHPALSAWLLAGATVRTLADVVYTFKYRLDPDIRLKS